MNLIPHINLLKGFCNLNFGALAIDAENAFGKPEEIQNLEDPILDTSCTVYHYWEKGFSLFFDNKNDKKFGSVEVDNENTLLFNEKIFSLNEKQVTDLMLKNNFLLSDTEVQEWGEKRLSFDDAGFDCYFENGKMTSINFGVIDDFDNFKFNLN